MPSPRTRIQTLQNYDVENWWFAICNAGAFQRPFEVRQALSFLPIVGYFGSTLGAQVS